MWQRVVGGVPEHFLSGLRESMFDGTNYLPARALAEALGLSVAWDGSTNTVVLKTAEAKADEIPATEKLVYDQNSVKIYYLGITAGSSSLGGSSINLRIENNSSKDIMSVVEAVHSGGNTTHHQLCPSPAPMTTRSAR